MSLDGLILALAFMTRLPTPPLKDDASLSLEKAAPWLPVVGLVVGGVVAGALWLAALALPPVAAGFAGLLAWVAVTGALHIEGLGDVTDGLGAAHKDSARFLAVARDPHVGSFGAVAMMLQIAGKLALLASLAGLPHGAPLVAIALIPAWARWATLLPARLVPPLAPGLGEALAKGVTWPAAAVTGAALAAASLAIAPVLIIAVPLAAAAVLYWRARLGGMTGDCMGATIEITETALLVALLVVPA